LFVRGRMDLRFGMQLDLLAIRPAVDADAVEGFDFADLYESSKYPAESLLVKVRELIEMGIEDAHVKQLVEAILQEHDSLIRRMPAAANFHHGYTAGLLEHIWSMARIAVYLAEHYRRYYRELNPPLNKSIVVAAAILHDIGKLK